MAYVHPVFGLMTVALLLWVGSRGLHSRERRRTAAAARGFHRRWAPITLALMWGVAIAGVASTIVLRSDRAAGTSWHFRIELVVLALATLGWWTSRRLPDATAKRIHPWLGVAVMLGAGAGVMFGLDLLP